MTTIAYKDGVIAYDSRSTCGDVITSDKADKLAKLKGASFFFAGAVCDQTAFMDVFFDTLMTDWGSITHLDAEALVWYGGALHHSGSGSKGFFSQPIPMENPRAIGSGSDHALTAMDCGLSAKEAVKMAALRDTRTGGRIRTFNLKT